MTPSPTPERLTPAECIDAANAFDVLADIPVKESSGESFKAIAMKLRAHAAYLETQQDALDAAFSKGVDAAWDTLHGRIVEGHAHIEVAFALPKPKPPEAR